LVAEIEEISNLYYSGAERANTLAQLRAEAKLATMADDLRGALGEELARVIPQDPLAMANLDAIRTEMGLLKARERQLKLALACADVAETRGTLESGQARLVSCALVS